jgi:hypothetical protein
MVVVVVIWISSYKDIVDIIDIIDIIQPTIPNDNHSLTLTSHLTHTHYTMTDFVTSPSSSSMLSCK